MSLVSCPHCGKEFRTEPGLAYHLGWAHKTAKTEEPHETNDEDEDVLDFIFGLMAAPRVAPAPPIPPVEVPSPLPPTAPPGAPPAPPVLPDPRKAIGVALLVVGLLLAIAGRKP